MMLKVNVAVSVGRERVTEMVLATLWPMCFFRRLIK